MAKLWPKLGHKRKKILHFHSFRVTCKISLVPGTGLEPALLSEHAPETCASTNSATRASGRVPTLGTFVVKKNNTKVVFCAQDKTWTCTALRRLPPQSSVSTNSTTWAKGVAFSYESGCKSTNFFRHSQKNLHFFCRQTLNHLKNKVPQSVFFRSERTRR